MWAAKLKMYVSGSFQKKSVCLRQWSLSLRADWRSYMWILDIFLPNWNIRECDTALMGLSFLICKLEIPAVNFYKAHFISSLRLLPYITVDSYFLGFFLLPEISFITIWWLRLSTSWMSLVVCVFERICPFLNCQFYWDKVAHSIPLLFKIIF